MNTVKQNIINEIELIPYEKLSELFNFVHSYRLGTNFKSKDFSESWDLEIKDRLSAIDSGILEGIDYETAMKNITNELT